MNYLFVAQQEIDPTPQANSFELRASLKSIRAQEAIEDHALKTGLTVSCVVEGQGRGSVYIEHCDLTRVDLRIQIKEPLPPRMAFDLVVAYARPQTIKKLLSLAASTGVRSLSFVRTAQVVPSYLQSKSLEEKEIQRHFTLGCEQVGDGAFPQFKQFKSLGDFLQSNLAQEQDGTDRFFGDTAELLDSRPYLKANTVLFIGPESGFSFEERAELIAQGFISKSLGSRIHRVEVAAALFLGQYCVP